MGHSKTSLFLMELIISILFFSLAATVCIQLFVHSHTLSRETVNMNNAIIETQNITEIYYSNDGNIENIPDYYAYSDLISESGRNTVTVFFDNDWNNIDSSLSQPSYLVVLDGDAAPDDSNNMNALVSVIAVDGTPASDSSCLYELELKYHIPYRKGDVVNE